MYIHTILDSVSSKVQNTFNNNQIGYDLYDFERWNDEKIKLKQKRKFIKNEKEKKLIAIRSISITLIRNNKKLIRELE